MTSRVILTVPQCRIALDIKCGITRFTCIVELHLKILGCHGYRQQGLGIILKIFEAWHHDNESEIYPASAHTYEQKGEYEMEVCNWEKLGQQKNMDMTQYV
uniref:Uncharacterized protein n=1 Tax=Romanomermis culicivorax TaxID=13658 RepID=A0A915KNB5_ROMCU